MVQKVNTSIIEVGNSTVKMITPSTKGEPVLIPSVVYVDDGSHIGGDVLSNGSTPPSLDNINVVIGGKNYLVGKAAYSATTEPWRVMGRAKFTDDKFKALVLGAISEGGIKGDVRLIMGLPVNWYKPQYTEALDLLKGEYTVERKGHRRRKVNIVDIVAKPETMGTIYSRMLSSKGEITKPKFMKARVYVADIGEFTTDLLAMEQFANIAALSDSKDYGCRNFYNELIKKIEQVYDKRVDMLELASVIATNALRNPKTGRTVDVSTIIAEVKAVVAQSLVSMFTTVWGDAQSADVIIVTGGGAALFGDLIKAHYGARVIVADAPQTANAIGFWYYSIYKGWNNG